MPRIPFNSSKTYSTPRRPFEKERLDQELKLIGEFGLRNKREVWRVKYVLTKIRTAARELLTLEEKDPRRLFEGSGVSLMLLLDGSEELCNICCVVYATVLFWPKSANVW